MYQGMNKKNLFKKNLVLINKIQKIKLKNNLNWMNLLKSCFKHDSKTSAKSFSNVFNDDKKISSLVGQLTKLNKSK